MLKKRIRETGVCVPVKVNWEQSKRNRPTSGRYATVARFFVDDDKWPDEAWSVVLEFSKQGNEFDYTNGKAAFLVNNAPDDWLISGIVFEMFEGSRKTATVAVL
jgi:hypothetical protein